MNKIIPIDINEATPVHYIATTGKQFLRPGTPVTCQDTNDSTQTLQWEGIINSCQYLWQHNIYHYEILLQNLPQEKETQ